MTYPRSKTSCLPSLTINPLRSWYCLLLEYVMYLECSATFNLPKRCKARSLPSQKMGVFRCLSCTSCPLRLTHSLQHTFFAISHYRFIASWFASLPSTCKESRVQQSLFVSQQRERGRVCVSLCACEGSRRRKPTIEESRNKMNRPSGGRKGGKATASALEEGRNPGRRNNPGVLYLTSYLLTY